MHATVGNRKEWTFCPPIFSVALTFVPEHPRSQPLVHIQMRLLRNWVLSFGCRVSKLRIGNWDSEMTTQLTEAKVSESPFLADVDCTHGSIYVIMCDVSFFIYSFIHYLHVWQLCVWRIGLYLHYAARRRYAYGWYVYFPIICILNAHNGTW